MDYSKMPLKELQNQFQQEKKIYDFLEESLSELKLSVEELDKRMDDYDDESNEWRTRFETQLELNQQLQHQSIVLSQKIDMAKQTIKELKQPRTNRHPDNVTPEFLKSLEKSRVMVEEQLRNLEMRLEEESKAYHKANEERKNFVLELNHLKNLNEVQSGLNNSINAGFPSNKKNLVRKLNSLTHHHHHAA